MLLLKYTICRCTALKKTYPPRTSGASWAPALLGPLLDEVVQRVLHLVQLLVALRRRAVLAACEPLALLCILGSWNPLVLSFQ